MRFPIAAALALTAATSLHAQAVTPANPDFTIATPLPGTWTYAPATGGSEATFLDASSRTQMFLRCTRAARQVTIAKPASGAAPFIVVWTSSQTRNLPASFTPATNRLSATVPAFDPILDAMAFSRGRIAFSVSGQPPLVVPSWEEVARVIEDCRA
jgi:hypothetical protein